MEVTTTTGAEAPEQDDAPETPVTQPPGESPESPEPAAPPQPGEAPAAPPEPETKPEPEADPDEDAGEAKKKAATLPESMTKAGRKRAAKASSTKAAPRAKAKAESKPDKEKEEQKKLREEYTALNKTFKERGTDMKTARRMRHVAEKLGRDVPKWAAVQSKAKDPDAPKRADDPDLKIAHEMTAYATNGRVVDGKVVAGDVKFGASVSARQVGLMREALKGKDILKFLKVPESKLAQYAAGKIKATDLPQEGRDAIKALNATFDPSLKMWARKDAVIALFLHRERKSAKAKSAKAEKQSEAVAA